MDSSLSLDAIDRKNKTASFALPLLPQTISTMPAYCEKDSQPSSGVTLMSYTHAPSVLNVAPAKTPFHATLPFCKSVNLLAGSLWMTIPHVQPFLLHLVLPRVNPARSLPLCLLLPQQSLPQQRPQVKFGALSIFKTLRRVGSWLPPEKLHVFAQCRRWR